jgi:hypothetical protein
MIDETCEYLKKLFGTSDFRGTSQHEQAVIFVVVGECSYQQAGDIVGLSRWTVRRACISKRKNQLV